MTEELKTLSRDIWRLALTTTVVAVVFGVLYVLQLRSGFMPHWTTEETRHAIDLVTDTKDLQNRLKGVMAGCNLTVLAYLNAIDFFVKLLVGQAILLAGMLGWYSYKLRRILQRSDLA